MKQKDCKSCVYWFLGCLHGRKTWADIAITPNFRHVGQSGNEYSRCDEEDKISADEYPLHAYCDSFEWDPNPERKGGIGFTFRVIKTGENEAQIYFE